jgi:hypothetical protein
MPPPGGHRRRRWWPGFGERWGYGALLVTNLFAWRATDPNAMRAAPDPVGQGNDAAILAAARAAGVVICAWGNHGAYLGRSSQVRGLLREAGILLHVLRLNTNGEPAHPLYLPARLAPARWR